MAPQQHYLCANAAVLAWSLLSTACISGAADSKHGNDMLRIPAGMFVMGSSEGPEDEHPQHQLQVAEFLIDRTPVTNAQFAQFINAKGTRAVDGQVWYDTDDNDARIHRQEGKWIADSGAEHHP
ncbi:MAG: SUMF1/EgtB/PvdO family nonheme iron enzyme, partial [Candidatus Binatia bacterium]